MRAWVLEAVRAPLVLAERPLPVPGAGEALVRVHAVALNRRDHWITLGLYPGARHALPAVLGSDGCGVVVAVGDDAHTAWVGRDVVLNPGERWGESEDVRAPSPPLPAPHFVGARRRLQLARPNAPWHAR